MCPCGIRSFVKRGHLFLRRACAERGARMRDSFLRRRGNLLFCNGCFNWHVSGWSSRRGGKKGRKRRDCVCLFARPSHFHERKFTRLSFCSGFKGATLNGLLPPSFLVRFPTPVSILAHRATSATSHDAWASCDLAAIVGIISMTSSHPAPISSSSPRLPCSVSSLSCLLADDA